MPELPEVETVCRSLRPHLLGRTVEKVTVLEPRLRLVVDANSLHRLSGKRVVAVDRTAKYILLQLSGDSVWLFHLGMSGKLICTAAGSPRRKHDHIVAHLDGGLELRYHDPRRFGLSLAASSGAVHELPQLRHLGLDPFDPALNAEYLYRFTRGSARRIRDLLLDQRIIAGLGNIYANEILALAGVKPTTRSHRLSRRRVGAIAEMIPQLLRDAIRWCGTSFSDYRDADDRAGEFQNHLRVYDRAGERCRTCAAVVKRVAVGNRSAFFCPNCQK